MKHIYFEMVEISIHVWGVCVCVCVCVCMKEEDPGPNYSKGDNWTILV